MYCLLSIIVTNKLYHYYVRIDCGEIATRVSLNFSHHLIARLLCTVFEYQTAYCYSDGVTLDRLQSRPTASGV